MKKKVRFLLIVLLSFTSVCYNYGQTPVKLNVGGCLGGKGLAGATAQLRPLKQLSFELGVYLKTTHVDVFEDYRFFGSAVDAGLDFYLFDRINDKNLRLTEYGFFLKAGYGLHKEGDYELVLLNERSACIGWFTEISKNSTKDRFIQIQLGPSVIERHVSHLNTRYPPGFQLESEDWLAPMIYARISWLFMADKSGKM